jgi:hypothetical protein
MRVQIIGSQKGRGHKILTIGRESILTFQLNIQAVSGFHLAVDGAPW